MTPVQLIFADGPTAMPQVLGGKVRALAVAQSVRLPLLPRGAEPRPGTPDEFAAFIRSEIAKWGKVVRDANIKAD